MASWQATTYPKRLLIRKIFEMRDVGVIFMCLFAQVVPHYVTHRRIPMRLPPMNDSLVGRRIYSPLHVESDTSHYFDIIILLAVILLH